ncbi:hypothetical protein HR12_03960 [Microbacterium sp. SUBG005]|nr:hypothetical protein HR12_03960 [Microbacterium sp. SUBG005]
MDDMAGFLEGAGAGDAMTDASDSHARRRRSAAITVSPAGRSPRFTRAVARSASGVLPRTTGGGD